MSNAREPAGPAAEFAEVWEMLDSLPRSAVQADLTATTLDLVAAVVERDVPAAGGPAWRRWLLPVVIVTGALAAGFAAGRATVPDGDAWLLENLPLVRHLDLLREAGSVKFLEEVARKRYPAPERPGLPPAETRQEESREFQAALDRLRDELAGTGTPDKDLAARRAAVLALPAEEKVELEQAVAEFRRLSGAEQRMLAATAAGLVDPGRPDLRDAALTWHQWLTATRPEERSGHVDAGTDKRLDWLDWYAARGEGRPPRPRDWDRDRRGPPGRVDGESPAEPGRFRPPRPPVTGAAPAGGPVAAPPAETQATPR